MVSKSASDTLDTLKGIINDISNAREVEAETNPAGAEIIAGILRTQSDEAETEKKFNRISSSSLLDSTLSRQVL